MKQINDKITTLIAKSIETLRSTLSKDGLKEVKSKLIDVYEHKVSTSDSYFNLQSENKLTIDEQDHVREAFYSIGNLIAVPSRGCTNLLKEAYQEDLGQEPDLPFLLYQLEVIGYVHDVVKNL